MNQKVRFQTRWMTRSVIAALALWLLGCGGSEQSAAADDRPLTVSCAAPQTTVTGAAGTTPSLSADVQGGDKSRMFASGASFSIVLRANVSAADTLQWRLADAWNQPVAEGRQTIAAGASTTTLTCSGTRAGYFAINASLASGRAGLAAVGTRPAGIATFGILPSLATLPAGAFADRRIGMQGTSFIESGNCCSGEPFAPVYGNLGITWGLDERSWAKLEPQYAGQYTPDAEAIRESFGRGKVARLISLSGLPQWATTEPLTGGNGIYPPRSFADWRSFLERLGREQAAARALFTPQQANNYYQVTWEPDPGTSTQWNGTDAQFVELYRTARQGLRATDPGALLMGPTTSNLRGCVEWLERLHPLGFTSHIDILSCHGYFADDTSLDTTPEAAGLPAQVRRLRASMKTRLPAGTRLFITEAGVSYPAGRDYAADYPPSDVLLRHAAVNLRVHLTLLGEGADVTYLFYSADYPGEIGFGLSFNLDYPRTPFGTPEISPKPAAMTIAAMTRVIEGANSLGPVAGLATGLSGYAFVRNGQPISAWWRVSGTGDHLQRVNRSGTSGSVNVIDAMGNSRSVRYTNGCVSLTLSEVPQYLMGGDLATLREQASAPDGASAGVAAASCPAGTAARTGTSAATGAGTSSGTKPTAR